MALDEITPPYTITISDTAANVAAHVGALNADSRVTLITISDTAANVVANLDALNDSSHVTVDRADGHGCPGADAERCAGPGRYDGARRHHDALYGHDLGYRRRRRGEPRRAERRQPGDVDCADRRRHPDADSHIGAVRERHQGARRDHDALCGRDLRDRRHGRSHLREPEQLRGQPSVLDHRHRQSTADRYGSSDHLGRRGSCAHVERERIGLRACGQGFDRQCVGRLRRAGRRQPCDVDCAHGQRHARADAQRCAGAGRHEGARRDHDRLYDHDFRHGRRRGGEPRRAERRQQ